MLHTDTGFSVGNNAPVNGTQVNGTSVLDWNMLTDEVQLWLSREALRRAAETIAGQAEVLAGEMEAGCLTDRGGADALRLLASVVRVTGSDDFACVGCA